MTNELYVWIIKVNDKELKAISSRRGKAFEKALRKYLYGCSYKRLVKINMELVFKNKYMTIA